MPVMTGRSAPGSPLVGQTVEVRADREDRFAAVRPVLARLVPVRGPLGRVASLAVFMLGVASVLQAVGGAPARWAASAEGWARVYQPVLAPGTAVLVGVGLLAIGRALLLRRANARWAAVIYLLALTLAGLRWAPSAQPGLGSALLAAVLVAAGREFDVPRATDVRPAFAKLLVVAAAVDLVLGTLLASAVDVVARPYDHLVRVARLVIGGLSGRRVWLPQGGAAHWLLPLLTAAGSITLLVLLAVLMAAPAEPLDGTRRRPGLVRSLAEHPEGDTLDPFALRIDKLHFVHSSPRAPARDGADPEVATAAIGYRPMFGVGLASGPPVGPPEVAADALRGFLDHCQRHGWRPAFIGLSEALARECRRLGFHCLCIGDEAVIDVAGFRLDTPRMRNVRQAVKRTHNFGVTTAVLREGDIEPALVAQLETLSSDARHGVPERGFSMGLGEPFSGWHPDCTVVVAYDRDGAPVGFQRYAPCRAGRALSLDIMRRRPGSSNGLNERMISDVVAWAAGHGVEEVSLNFAAFRNLMDLGSDRSRLQQVEYWLVHRLDRWIMVESLYRFNAKFRPRWVPRYVAFRSFADLPWLMVAALNAEFSLPVDRLSVRPAPDWMPAPEPVTLP